MRKFNQIFRVMLFIGVALACVSQASSDGYISVRRVFDGDTIELTNGMHVRYIDINAPEIAHQDNPGEPFGPEALVFNEKIVLSKPVRIQEDQEAMDQYNRRLACVFLRDGTFVNQEIVRNGLAHILYKASNIAHDTRIVENPAGGHENRKGDVGELEGKIV